MGNQISEQIQSEKHLFSNTKNYCDQATQLKSQNIENDHSTPAQALLEKEQERDALLSLKLVNSDIIILQKSRQQANLPRMDSKSIKDEQIDMSERKQQNNQLIEKQEMKSCDQLIRNQLIYSSKVLKNHQQQKSQQNKSIFSDQMISIINFSNHLKSPTIQATLDSTGATQMSSYWQNKKLILTEPIQSNRARAVFQVKNLKYCVGVGVALKQVIEKHQFTYQSHENELSHGLFLVTSQGYSWSHTYKSQDDILRPQFNKIKTNDTIEVVLEYSSLTFRYKKSAFILEIPESVLKKYTLCFCAYLHEKSDSLHFKQQKNYEMTPIY